MKRIHIFIILFLSISAKGQTNLFPHAIQKWVDSVFATLSIDQKIGQVLMPRGNSNPVYDDRECEDDSRAPSLALPPTN